MIFSSAGKYRSIVLIVLLGLAVSGFGQEAEGPVALSSRVDKSRITIGDLITYTVTVTHDEDVTVTLPGTGANLGGFEIRDYHVGKPEKKAGRIVREAEYVISTFFTGEFEIPPLTVYYTLAGDSSARPLSTEPIRIMVESVKASEAGDIRDIKEPEEYPWNWWWALRWYILGAAVLLLAAAAWFVYRRKKAGRGLLPVRETPPRPPHETALEALERLKAADLPARGEIKQYYIEISEIIRRYIEGRYFVDAMEMTTCEVMTALSGLEIKEPDYHDFGDFLSRCDMVKFAKVIPPQKEITAIMEAACDLVDRTKVVIAPESGEDPEVSGSGENGGADEEKAVINEAEVS